MEHKYKVGQKVRVIVRVIMAGQHRDCTVDATIKVVPKVLGHKYTLTVLVGDAEFTIYCPEAVIWIEEAH